MKPISPRRSAQALFLTGLLVGAGQASAINVYDEFLKQTEQSKYQTDLSFELIQYITMVMNTRAVNPVSISAEDVHLAQQGKWLNVCAARPERPSFSFCTQLNTDIQYLIESERELQLFADELVTITNSSELVATDEAHRPNSFGIQTAAFSAIWNGEDAKRLPWPESANDAFENLVSALQSEGSLDKVVLRFHFGLHRMTREEDAGWEGFQMYGSQTKEALEELSNILSITEDNVGKENLAEYATPKILSDSLNIGLWAREDDIGLNWIYPMTHPRFDLDIPTDYPKYQSGGTVDVDKGLWLSYPFRYDVEEFPDMSDELEEKLKSPLCSRISGAQGYLCRAVEDGEKNCPDVPEGDYAIHLVTCDEKERIVTPGMDICSSEELKDRFTVKLNGTTVTTPEGEDLTVCTPGTSTEFESSFVTNSCYIGYCLEESFNKHNLTGGRNTIAIMESTSPYLSCIRPDPQLGMISELPPAASTVLPQYLGHHLMHAFDREFCERTAYIPGVAGLCEYRHNRQLESPFQSPAQILTQNEEQFQRIADSQEYLNDAAFAIGQQYAINQAVPVYEKTIRSVAQGVNAIADLFLELKDAPITNQACPWNGQLCSNVCDDRIDNDGDGKKDMEDFGCDSLIDQSELADCEDGLDNDNDGLVDYPEDPDCGDAKDPTES